LLPFLLSCRHRASARRARPFPLTRGGCPRGPAFPRSLPCPPRFAGCSRREGYCPSACLAWPAWRWSTATSRRPRPAPRRGPTPGRGPAAAPAGGGGPPARAAPTPPTPRDEPLRLLGRAQQVFRGVRDYTCTLIKQERINGQLQPMNVMTMMVRNEPFSIYL